MFIKSQVDPKAEAGGAQGGAPPRGAGAVGVGGRSSNFVRITKSVRTFSCLPLVLTLPGYYSFPRSAWERPSRRSASSARGAQGDGMLPVTTRCSRANTTRPCADDAERRSDAVPTRSVGTSIEYFLLRNSFPRSAWECLPIDAPRRLLRASPPREAARHSGHRVPSHLRPPRRPPRLPGADDAERRSESVPTRSVGTSIFSIFTRSQAPRGNVPPDAPRHPLRAGRSPVSRPDCTAMPTRSR